LATFVQDGKKYFVSGSTDKTLKIWDGAEHICETTLTSSNFICSLYTFTVGGHNYVACGGLHPYEIEIWNIETKQCVKTSKGTLQVSLPYWHFS